jgi:acyl-CoA thioester hydrolase
MHIFWGLVFHAHIIPKTSLPCSPLAHWPARTVLWVWSFYLNGQAEQQKRYNFRMPKYRFYYPIEVRYGDLDPQGHVNNAKYLTYLEQTRAQYLSHLGLWDGQNFMEIGIILAEARVTFLAPVLYGQPVRVGACVSRIGNKSIHMRYSIEDAHNGAELATASSVLVAFDYQNSRSIPVPEAWRKAVADFEGLSFSE